MRDNHSFEVSSSFVKEKEEIARKLIAAFYL
jgi:hypothetical protein